MEEDRLLNSQIDGEEIQFDNKLRPSQLGEYVGQEKIKENLEIFISAAKMRNDSLDHVLFYGPPGLGKTTLANIIAKEMDASIKSTSGPVIEKSGDLAALLTNLKHGDVLFIDEIHRLNRVVEEVLYSAMEDFFLSWVVGKGLSARNVNLRINPFTLVGATTRFSLISAPLRDRFGSVFRLDYYGQSDMEVVVSRSAEILATKADAGGITEIASRSRGTPRIGNRLLKRTRDYALVEADNYITTNVAQKALEMLKVDSNGLDESDHRLLSSIIDKFRGGPVGLETLSASLSEDSDTVMEVWEPYLLQLGFLERTSRGRVATKRAYEYLGKPWIEESEPSDQARLSGF